MLSLRFSTNLRIILKKEITCLINVNTVQITTGNKSYLFRFEEDETPNSRAAVKVLGAPLLTPFPLIDPDNPEADEDAIGT